MRIYAFVFIKYVVKVLVLMSNNKAIKIPKLIS